MLGWGDFWTCGFAQVWISKPNLYSIFGSHEVIHWASLGTQSLVCWLKIWSQQTWKLKAVLQEKKFKSSVASSEIYFQEVRNWRGSGGWGRSFLSNWCKIESLWWLRLGCCTLWRSKTKSRVDPKEYFKGKRLRSWSCSLSIHHRLQPGTSTDSRDSELIHSYICSNSYLKISITACTVGLKYVNILYLLRPGEFQAH